MNVFVGFWWDLTFIPVLDLDFHSVGGFEAY